MDKKIFKLSAGNVTLNGKPCKNPKITWENPSCGDISCVYKDGTIKVEIPEYCDGECFYVNISCSDGDCQDCVSVRKKICPCTDSVDCGDCETCQDGVCVSTCPEGKLCLNDTCVDCTDSSNCDGGKVCVDGVCECPPSKPYLNSRGQCVPCVDDTCGPCETCTPEGCVPIVCPEGVCNPTTGTCTECIDAANCDQYEQCIDGRCECLGGLMRDNNGNCVPPPECDGDSSCPDCSICVDGRCTPITCPPGYTCHNGTCVPVCDCDTGDCPSGRGCTKIGINRCVCLACEGPCSGNGDCGDGCYCDNGTCRKAPCDEVYCDTGDECGLDCGCEGGKCVPCAGSCDDNGNCADGCYCFNGNCVGNPCDSVTCNNGDDCGEGCGCLNGNCYPCASIPCNDNQSGCDGALGCECVNGNCDPSPCGGPCDQYGDCAEGCACVDGLCIPCSTLSCTNGECADHPSCACQADGTCGDGPCTNDQIFTCQDDQYSSKSDCSRVSLMIDESGGLANQQNDINLALNQFRNDLTNANSNIDLSITSASSTGTVQIPLGQTGNYTYNPNGYSNFTDGADKAYGELFGQGSNNSNCDNTDCTDPADCDACSQDRTLVLFLGGQNNTVVTPPGNTYTNTGVNAGSATNGGQNDDLIKMADKARSCGVNVIVVAYGEQVNGDADFCEVLDRVANDPSDPNADNLILIPAPDSSTTPNQGAGGDFAAKGFEELVNRIARNKTQDGGCVPATLGQGSCGCDCEDPDDGKNHVCIPGQGCIEVKNKSDYPNLPRVTQEECCEECNQIECWDCPDNGSECIPLSGDDCTTQSSKTEAECNLACKCCEITIAGLSQDCGSGATLNISVNNCPNVNVATDVNISVSGAGFNYNGNVAGFQGATLPQSGTYTVSAQVASATTDTSDCAVTQTFNVNLPDCCNQSIVCGKSGSDVTYDPDTKIIQVITIAGNPVPTGISIPGINVLPPVCAPGASNSTICGFQVVGGLPAGASNVTLTYNDDDCDLSATCPVDVIVQPDCFSAIIPTVCEGATTYIAAVTINQTGIYDLKIVQGGAIIETIQNVGQGVQNVTISNAAAAQSAQVIEFRLCDPGTTNEVCDKVTVSLITEVCNGDFGCVINPNPVCQGSPAAITITNNSGAGSYLLTVTGNGGPATIPLGNSSIDIQLDTSVAGTFTTTIDIIDANTFAPAGTLTKTITVLEECDSQCFDCEAAVGKPQLNCTSTVLAGNQATIVLASFVGSTAGVTINTNQGAVVQDGTNPTWFLDTTGLSGDIAVTVDIVGYDANGVNPCPCDYSLSCVIGVTECEGCAPQEDFFINVETQSGDNVPLSNIPVGPIRFFASNPGGCELGDDIVIEIYAGVVDCTNGTPLAVVQEGQLWDSSPFGSGEYYIKISGTYENGCPLVDDQCRLIEITEAVQTPCVATITNFELSPNPSSSGSGNNQLSFDWDVSTCGSVDYTLTVAGVQVSTGIVSGGSFTVGNISYSGIPAGDHPAVLSVTCFSGGCSTTLSTTVTIEDPNTDCTLVCSGISGPGNPPVGTPVTYTASGVGGNVGAISYQWSVSGQAVGGNSSTLNYTFPTDEPSQICVKITDGGVTGCVAECCIFVSPEDGGGGSTCESTGINYTISQTSGLSVGDTITVNFTGGVTTCPNNETIVNEITYSSPSNCAGGGNATVSGNSASFSYLGSSSGFGGSIQIVSKCDPSQEGCEESVTIFLQGDPC